MILLPFSEYGQLHPKAPRMNKPFKCKGPEELLASADGTKLTALVLNIKKCPGV